MLLCIGGTGTGKTNALMNYLARSSGEFTKIIICSFSTTDVPSYRTIKEKNCDVELIDNIDEVPDLDEFDDKYKYKPKLIVFDDFINLKKKKCLKFINIKLLNVNLGSAVFLMAQWYIHVDKIISRNIQYYILFKLNDNVSLDRIIRNHNII